jgi:hypothetical protein
MFHKLQGSVCNIVLHLLEFLGSTFKNIFFIFNPIPTVVNLVKYLKMKERKLHLPDYCLQTDHDESR